MSCHMTKMGGAFSWLRIDSRKSTENSTASYVGQLKHFERAKRELLRLFLPCLILSAAF